MIATMRPGGRAAIVAAVAAALFAGACTAGAVPTPSPTAAPTATPAPTPTATPMPTPTATPAPTPMPTPLPGTVDEPREIVVTMTDDLRYDPDTIEVRAGETIRFVVTNPTPLDHDFTVGDEMTQMHHEEEMADFYGHDGGDMHHRDASNAVLVAPGETAELVVTFETPGELLIGCHVPGHYEAGMRGTITVAR